MSILTFFLQPILIKFKKTNCNFHTEVHRTVAPAPFQSSEAKWSKRQSRQKKSSPQTKRKAATDKQKTSRQRQRAFFRAPFALQTLVRSGLGPMSRYPQSISMVVARLLDVMECQLRLKLAARLWSVSSEVDNLTGVFSFMV